MTKPNDEQMVFGGGTGRMYMGWAALAIATPVMFLAKAAEPFTYFLVLCGCMVAGLFALTCGGYGLNADDEREQNHGKLLFITSILFCIVCGLRTFFAALTALFQGGSFI